MWAGKLKRKRKLSLKTASDVVKAHDCEAIANELVTKVYLNRSSSGKPAAISVATLLLSPIASEVYLSSAQAGCQTNLPHKPLPREVFLVSQLSVSACYSVVRMEPFPCAFKLLGNCITNSSESMRVSPLVVPIVCSISGSIDSVLP